MADAATTHALQLAQQHYAAGEFALADSELRQLVAKDPSCAAAWHGLGLIAMRGSNYAAAAELINRTVALEPGNAAALCNLGAAYQNLERSADAIACFEAALRHKEDALTHYNLGTVLQKSGRAADAIACFGRALQLNAEYFQAYNNLGSALEELGRGTEAIDCYRQALAIKADHVPSLLNLAGALQKRGQTRQAIDAYRQAVALEPDNVDGHYQLGVILHNLRRLDEAEVCYEAVLALDPNSWHAHVGLGSIIADQGKIQLAIVHYRKALALNPDSLVAQQRLLLALHFDPAQDAQSIFSEHLRFAERFERPLLASHRAHLVDRRTDRKLRIGYVSPDFRIHPVGQSLVPLLANHDPEQFEIYCYDAKTCGDDWVTQELKSHAHCWREIQALSDQRAAELIRDDGIDILVDLCMHTNGSRLLIFAYKPAPVQVTYLGYPGTTGLSSIDYRLTDLYLDPPGERSDIYTEKSLHLSCCYWCYRPSLQMPNVSALPALKRGLVTFGCLNNFAKVNPQTLRLWKEVLAATLDSCLLLQCASKKAREEVRAFFANEGIDPKRIEFVDRLPQQEYLAAYHNIDIALDPFPYPGHTTTLDGLYMGVPSVTLRGDTAVSRGGASILSHLGLDELIAHTPQRYVEIAISLAGDLDRLAALRANLRNRMRQSPLMDEPAYAREIEKAYRSMWRYHFATC